VARAPVTVGVRAGVSAAEDGAAALSTNTTPAPPDSTENSRSGRPRKAERFMTASTAIHRRKMHQSQCAARVLQARHRPHPGHPDCHHPRFWSKRARWHPRREITHAGTRTGLKGRSSSTVAVTARARRATRQSFPSDRPPGAGRTAPVSSCGRGHRGYVTAGTVSGRVRG